MVLTKLQVPAGVPTKIITRRTKRHPPAQAATYRRNNPYIQLQQSPACAVVLHLKQRTDQTKTQPITANPGALLKNYTTMPPVTRARHYIITRNLRSHSWSVFSFIILLHGLFHLVYGTPFGCVYVACLAVCNIILPARVKMPSASFGVTPGADVFHTAKGCRNLALSLARDLAWRRPDDHGVLLR